MSTRTQIRIVSDGKATDLYHHWDGYFEGVGMELHTALQLADEPKKLLENLLKTPGYEPADGRHCDIEYWYLLDFDNRSFKGYECDWPVWTNGFDYDVLLTHPVNDKPVFDIEKGEVIG